MLAAPPARAAAIAAVWCFALIVQPAVVGAAAANRSTAALPGQSSQPCGRGLCIGPSLLLLRKANANATRAS